mmetsp:Transcript_15611/g.27404  ORF Transcript_15611/g.27404 Transcript_15611/m.27404 type:complete len:319 (-) Transcript_15611:248-1204(-)|eukprot:CAMPEP_0184692710 /NCGR_PEP_ID=MMETSP0313-20130426/1071_1 /TAXON_ID=2792 /ORGANISM="Porphyridium aerugineum, Strain SAG 1380-2" /LENGTH=318 /DNA_ID=CAMNT_0027150559 /DNA_START=529 /DNA_END=1485 /DNA_ORIENTATION=+
MARCLSTLIALSLILGLASMAQASFNLDNDQFQLQDDDVLALETSTVVSACSPDRIISKSDMRAKLNELANLFFRGVEKKSPGQTATFVKVAWRSLKAAYDDSKSFCYDQAMVEMLAGFVQAWVQTTTRYTTSDKLASRLAANPEDSIRILMVDRAQQLIERVRALEAAGANLETIASEHTAVDCGTTCYSASTFPTTATNTYCAQFGSGFTQCKVSHTYAYRQGWSTARISCTDFFFAHDICNWSRGCENASALESALISRAQYYINYSDTIMQNACGGVWTCMNRYVCEKVCFVTSSWLAGLNVPTNYYTMTACSR